MGGIVLFSLKQLYSNAKICACDLVKRAQTISIMYEYIRGKNLTKKPEACSAHPPAVPSAGNFISACLSKSLSNTSEGVFCSPAAPSFRKSRPTDFAKSHRPLQSRTKHFPKYAWSFFSLLTWTTFTKGERLFPLWCCHRLSVNSSR